MNIKSDKNDLLGSLKALLSQVNLLIGQKRLRSHRAVFKKKNVYNITSVLNQEVDKLASNTASHSQVKNETINKAQQAGGDYSKAGEKYKSTKSTSNVEISGQESEFVRHLKQSKSFSVAHSNMGDKLVNSAWDHLHSAVRYAKQGQVDKAKLNTDIAGHALDEAAHYLTDEEYTDLITRIENYFKESN